MATWESVGGIPLAIINGEHDDNLEYIQNACKQRIKMRFRRGQRIRLVNTKNVELEGSAGVIEKVNTKSISVILDSGGGYNVPPRMLEVV